MSTRARRSHALPDLRRRAGLGRLLPPLSLRLTLAPRGCRASVPVAPAASAWPSSSTAGHERALHHATGCHELRPDAESHRLLALCNLAERTMARGDLKRPDAPRRPERLEGVAGCRPSARLALD